MPRRLKRDFVTEYLYDVGPATESPTKYHEWCALSCISAALKRHVWIDRIKYKLYPNLFVVLVGRPGIGKGAAMNPAVHLMREAKTANIISDRTTMEYAMEKMSVGFPVVSAGTTGIKVGVESATLIASTELSVFISASQFTIQCLSALWDTNEEDFQYGTRGKGEFKIHNPYVGLLGASAPDWLVKSIPADAVGGGFTRRVNFVFATKKDKKVPWPSRNGNATYPLLVNDLREISRLSGQFNFTDKARQLFEPYYNSCEPNEFDDEATAVYKNSKWANASKLAMCLSASRGDSMEINEVDFQHAVDLTEEVAGDLKIIFRAVGESELVSGQDKVLRFIEIKGYASRDEVLRLNYRHITSDDLDRIIATLTESGYLIEVQVGKKTIYKLSGSISPTIVP